ncbi:MAG: heavy metal-responsive transcriptional regulator [Bdellovibrio sp.]|nr:heavy metal-responsive transcriptional regulator [Bdellovibrio sp.]
MKSGTQIQYTAGSLAKAAGVNIQTVRFYDREGILGPHGRTEAGYRIYNQEGLKQLKFIQEAKGLGFTLAEIKELLGLRVRSVQCCDRIRKKTEQKLVDIQVKIRQLQRLERTLKKLVQNCNDRIVSEQCPILARMEG